MDQGLQRLRQEDLFVIPASAIGDDLQELRRLSNGIEAEFTRRLRRFDQGGGYAATAALSAKAWLRWKCNFSPSAAADRVAVAAGWPTCLKRLKHSPTATSAIRTRR
jgi:hypothetical protein